MFQQEQPLIYLLYSQLTNVIQILITRTCRKVDLSYDKVFETSNLLEPKDVVLSDDCLKELSMVTELKKILCLKDALSHHMK